MTGAPKPPGSVLFVCTQNAVRSPMAAGLLRRKAGRLVHVRSCGVRGDSEVDGYAVAVMDEIGVDLHDHHPQSIDRLDETLFDLVVTLSAEADVVVRDLLRADATTIEHWPMAEPDSHFETRDQRLASYRDLREALSQRIDHLFPTQPLSAGG
jgi:protein-tyrosine-phosphatase